MEEIEQTKKDETILVKWKNPPSVSDLQQEFDDAKSSHSDQVKKIENYLYHLEGKTGLKDKPGRSKMQPKLIRKQAEWRYASLEEPFLSTKDLFKIDPRTYEDKSAATQNEILINYQINTQIDKVAFINEYIRTAVDEGTVIIQVGWKHEKMKVTVPVEVELTPEQAQVYLYKMVAEKKITQEKAISILQSGSPIKTTISKENIVTSVNHPTLRVCEYNKIVIDPTCEGDLDKAQFIIIPFETSLSELMKDETYKNLDKIFDIAGNSFVDSTSDDTVYYESITNKTGFTFKDIARKKVTAYEYYGYWDIDGKGITTPIKAVWVGNTMIKLEELPYPDKKLPFVSVQFMPVRKSVYGEPDGVLLEDNQAILGAVTRGMIDILGRTANGQTLMAKGMLDPMNLKKYENGEHAYYNPNMDPRMHIHSLVYPEIPNSAMQLMNIMNQEAESLTGVMAFSNGISGQALGDTATGVRSALDSASKRELGILRRLSKGIEQIGRKFIAMNSEFLEDEEIIRISNDFVKIRRDDLAGNFDLIVNVSTAEVDNQKIEKLAFMMQTGQQTMDPEEAKLVRAEIYRLQKMPELAEKVLTFQPQPDPIQQQMQQLQLEAMMLNNEKLKAEIQERNSRANENTIDMDLKRAKAQNEWNKAGLVNSEKDLKNLEFIQKESGIDFDREMAKKEHDRVAGLDSIAMTNMFQHKGQTK